MIHHEHTRMSSYVFSCRYSPSEQQWTCGECRIIEPVLVSLSARQTPPQTGPFHKPPRCLHPPPSTPPPPTKPHLPLNYTKPPPPKAPSRNLEQPPAPPPPKCTKPEEWQMGTGSASRTRRVINMGFLIRKYIREPYSGPPPSQDVQLGTLLKNPFLISNMFLKIVPVGVRDLQLRLVYPS